MSVKFYTEIFKHSGASYHQAMQLYPSARDEEFNSALALLNTNDQDRVLDVPAGGGYLWRYLDETVEYKGFDFSGGFTASSQIGRCSELNIPIEDSTIDKVICLAAMHHVEDKSKFLGELHRCLVTGGRLVIGDVITKSKEAMFLNGFVNHWNSLGHDGDFIHTHRDLALLRESGFTARSVNKRFHWNFTSEQDCHTYLKLLFNLDKQPSEHLLRSAIQGLGSNSTHSEFHLHWSLGFLVATKL